MPGPHLGTFVLLAALAATSAPAQNAPSTMFRGNPEHTGTSNAPLFAGQGGIRWRVRTNGPIRSSPAVTASHLYVGSGDGSLYAITRSSGAITWRFRAGGPVDASPAVAGGLVVAATIAGRIFAVDQASGRLRWARQTGPALPRNSSIGGAWDLWASSPTIVDRTVLIGGVDGIVYALDLTTGREKWRARTGGRVRSTPAVDDGVVAVGSWDGRVYAFDLASGHELWVHRTVGDTLDVGRCGYDCRAVQGSAAIVDGRVFVGARDGGLYALNLATGMREWRVSHHGSWVIGSPAVQEGIVYAGSSDGHFIQAVEAGSGTEVWHLPTRANVLSSPLWVAGMILVGTHRTDAPWGDLLAIDAARGTLRWRLHFDDQINSSPVVADSEIYVGTEGGSIFAIHEVSRIIPQLAVFFDSTLTGEPFAVGGRLAFEYFRESGYQPLDAAGLARFCTDRIADGVPSVVVLAMDILPKTVAPVMSDTVLIRRYLDAGGKVVSFSALLGGAVRDSTGRLRGDDPKPMEQMLGVPASAMDYDQNAARPTTAGRTWGLDQTVYGDYGMDVGAVTVALAVDPYRRATAWVKVFRPDHPGSGYVQLWGLGATVDRLPMIQAVAEYGLLRDVGRNNNAP